MASKKAKSGSKKAAGGGKQGGAAKPSAKKLPTKPKSTPQAAAKRKPASGKPKGADAPKSAPAAKKAPPPAKGAAKQAPGGAKPAPKATPSQANAPLRANPGGKPQGKSLILPPASATGKKGGSDPLRIAPRSPSSMGGRPGIATRPPGNAKGGVQLRAGASRVARCPTTGAGANARTSSFGSSVDGDGRAAPSHPRSQAGVASDLGGARSFDRQAPLGPTRGVPAALLRELRDVVDLPRQRARRRRLHDRGASRGAREGRPASGRRFGSPTRCRRNPPAPRGDRVHPRLRDEEAATADHRHREEDLPHPPSERGRSENGEVPERHSASTGSTSTSTRSPTRLATKSAKSSTG